jgi:hypothetical protein
MPSIRSVCDENSPDRVVVAFEDFEIESVEEWTDGVIGTTTEEAPTKFVGPFSGTKPSKTFALPEGTDSVRVSFQFYEFDSWDGDGLVDGPDKFFVRVNEKLVDLGFFNFDGSEVDDGNTDGILWSHSFTSTPRQFGGTLYHWHYRH